MHEQVDHWYEADKYIILLIVHGYLINIATSIQKRKCNTMRRNKQTNKQKMKLYYMKTIN